MQATITMADDTPAGVHYPNGHYGNMNNREITPAMMAALNGTQAANQYTFRAPSPPHIHIPSALDEQVFTLQIPANSGYTAIEADILRRVAQPTTPIPPNGIDWKYESRRKPQDILPFLQLGPSSSVRDIETLRAEGITMLLVVRNRMMGQIMSGDRVAKQLGIEWMPIDVGGHQELIASFPQIIKLINDHLISSYRRMAREDDEQSGRTTWGKILVYCESGNERSAAVVAAYMMTMFALDMTVAVQFVQQRRFCVAYDDGLKQILQSYGDILDARRAVSNAAPAPFAAPAKRSRDVDDDDPMGMDIDRFIDRDPRAPFHDMN